MRPPPPRAFSAPLNLQLLIVAGVCADYLEVNAIGLAFPQLRVKVKNNGEVRAKLVEETSGGRGDRFPYPFVLEPRGTVQYFDQHEQISISGMIFRNPMVLMMLFMGLMSYAMPKMMENMDPEVNTTPIP